MKRRATSQQGSSSNGVMGVLLPLYAVGIVIFYIYSMTKVCFKKTFTNLHLEYAVQWHSEGVWRPGQIVLMAPSTSENPEKQKRSSPILLS